MTNFAGNDYLGLARDRRLADACAEAASKYGISSTSSRWGLGWTEVHQALEQGLAEFHNVPAACLLGKAFMGGLVYFHVMSQFHDTVYCDEYCHTNLFIGMRAAGVKIVPYNHLDSEDLRQKISGHTGRSPIVATDSVYGISGELAPLAEISAIAKEYDAQLLVDDAHGVFVLGETGRGAIELCGLSPHDATVIGSMSKALGGGGGFLLGQEEFVEGFRRSPPASGSSVPPIPIAAADLKGLELVGTDASLQENLRANERKMREILAKHEIPVVADQTPIVAMQLADEFQAAALAEHFLQYGLRIPYFKYAAEPRHNMLRSVARSCYSADDLNRFGEAVESWCCKSR